MFPLKERSGAMGMVFSGLAIGTGLAFAVGGYASQHWGWRSVFLLAGIPGMLLAVTMWFCLKVPTRQQIQAQGGTPTPPMWKVILFALRSRPVAMTIVGLTIATMSSASVWSWTAPILVRQHGFSLAEAGLIVGLAAGVVKFTSTVGSGFLADWLAKGRLDRLWIVPTTAMVLSAPIAVAISIAPSKWLVIVLVMLLGLMMGTHYSSPKTVIISSAPDNMRGSVAAIEQLTINLIGGGLGPLLTGFISDQIGGKESAAQALAATLSLNIVAGLLFWLATRGTGKTEADPTVVTAH
jgi:predicted MFS family arabinose efflux permease